MNRATSASIPLAQSLLILLCHRIQIMAEEDIAAKVVVRYESFGLLPVALLLSFPPVAAVLTAHLVSGVLKSEVM